MRTLFSFPVSSRSYQQTPTFLSLSLSKNNPIKSSLLKSTKRGPEMSSSLMHSDPIHQRGHTFPDIQPWMHQTKTQIKHTMLSIITHSRTRKTANQTINSKRLVSAMPYHEILTSSILL